MASIALSSEIKELVRKSNAIYWKHFDPMIHESMMCWTHCYNDIYNPWPTGGVLTTEDFR